MICNFVSILLLPWSSRVVPKCPNGLSRCSRDAKMATQGAPEVPKWLPECQKGGTKAPKWQSREAKRGRRQRAQPLR